MEECEVRVRYLIQQPSITELSVRKPSSNKDTKNMNQSPAATRINLMAGGKASRGPSGKGRRERPPWVPYCRPVTIGRGQT